MQQIPVTQVQPLVAQWAANGLPEPVLLDVREDVELAIASIRLPGTRFVHCPMGEVSRRWTELDPAAPVLCLCHHGVRSQQVGLFLSQKGLNVANIAGGIHAWSAQVDPSVPMY